MVFYSHGCYLVAYGGGFFCYRYEVGDNCLFNIDGFFCYSADIERVAVIFWDLNNLKVTNDRLGHAEGDALIEKMSAILYGWMDRRCRVYRVGGDEFLMVLDNPEASETENMIAGIRRQMSETRTDNGFVISSAVGYSEGSGKDICEVVKQADESMYKDKARCKRNGDDMSRRDEG